MKSIKDELEYLHKKYGTLNPPDVVKYAENKNTVLHDSFEWDDNKAAYEHRLWQARQIIVRVSVSMPEKGIESVQMYVSLLEDRKAGKGYRDIVEVMSDKEYRKQLLNQAIMDFEYFEQKYKMLGELSDLFKVGKNIKNLIVV